MDIDDQEYIISKQEYTKIYKTLLTTSPDWQIRVPEFEPDAQEFILKVPPDGEIWCWCEISPFRYVRQSKRGEFHISMEMFVDDIESIAGRGDTIEEALHAMLLAVADVKRHLQPDLFRNLMHTFAKVPCPICDRELGE